jgi:hypothetical protein
MSIQINGTSGISGIDGTAGTPALQGTDSNTGISFGADTVNINTGGTTRATVDSSGRVLVGTATARTYTTGGAGGNHKLQLETAGATSVFTTAGIYSNSDVAGLGAYLELGRSKGTSLGAVTAVAQDDVLGEIRFAGTNGTAANPAASIAGYVDGAVSGGGANDMPGRLVFSTTADGASSPTERMRITNDGSLFLYTLSGSVSAMANIKYDTSTKEVYYDTSSRLAKENIADLKQGLDAVKAIQPRTYTAIGGDPNQEIIGFIADELVSVVPEAVFSGVKSAITGNDEDTEIIPLGISYDSLIPVLVKALQEATAKIESLEDRLSALESA